MRASKLRVQALCAAAALAAAAPAGADDGDAATDPEPARLTPAGVSFWEWLVAPHEREVEVALTKARENLATAHNMFPLWDYHGPLDPARLDDRRRLLDDAEGMLRYALDLVPGDPRLHLELGRVAEENGRPEQARVALERYLEEEIPERVLAEAYWRLGRVYARQEEWDQAISMLRLALGGRRPSETFRASATLLLAGAYMELGRLAEAEDLLRSSIAAVQHVWGHNWALQFALVVVYDRDEQITLAHETLEKLLAATRHLPLAHVLHDQHARITFAPAIDLHYFTALKLEAIGHLPEARREWQAYAAHPGARYRARALAHVEAIDRLTAERRATRPRPNPASRDR